MKRGQASGPKLERKTVEKNRRIHMKNICRELVSLIPSQHHSRVPLSQQDCFEQAADYIKKTEKRINELKRKRDLVMAAEGINKDTSGEMMTGLRLPIVELSDLGPILKVVLISGLENNVMLSDVITVLEEEGAEVVSANQYSVADSCFHVLHSQVSSSRVGYESERVHKRLKEIVH
ncbi:hypothetical protein MRB53_031494 [Persea americana]|uniref:Uncharacterized protein n=1 Tax=Persea americana TaxID=3435 RepID=A0ACC2KP92_PERAE|nr:hypothetical protein MRB53_031494 [Persea americana]